MRLFRKSDKKDTVLHSEVNSTTNSNQQAPAAGSVRNAESPMSRIDIEKRIREEAKRMRVTDQLLSAPHLQRVQETLRLNETKLANVEENLMRTREQKDRLRRYKELQGEIEVLRAHLFETNKLAASMMSDKTDLDRFETFENMQGRFQRLQILERQRRQEKMHSSEIAARLEEAQHALNDEQKRTAQCQDEANDAEKNLRLGQIALENALRLDGSNNTYDYHLQKAKDKLNNLTSRCSAMAKDLQEQDNAIAEQEKSIEKKNTRLQSTEAHRRMAKHGELVVELLNQFHTLYQQENSCESKMKAAERQQRSENDILGRVFNEYQQVMAQINTLKDELHMHRQSILGQDGNQLQERAMRFKRRRQMLMSAQGLWHRISTLYNLIEDKTVAINALRLHGEQTTSNLKKLETELAILQRSYHEKEYTFTLSKSQNVIQLRADLREGASCTVCGATHHPYHSDTMLEQNKLIGELKTETELLQAELRNKEAETQATRLDLERTTTAKKNAEDELILFRTLQNEAVKEWAMYAELDSTFHSCDSTTNAEARAAMIQQLIENSEQEVKKAQTELDTYNFHQNSINDLTVQLARQEQLRVELDTRMSEVNTSCQVLAREVEFHSTYKQELAERVGKLLEKLDKLVSLPDWKNTWKRSHESIIMQVQEITNERNTLGTEVKEQLAQLEQMKAVREQMATRLSELRAQQQETTDTINSYENHKKENQKEQERLLGGQKTKQYADQLLHNHTARRQALEKQQQITEKLKEEYLRTQGMADELRLTMENTDAMAVTERSALDIWIRQYNASHSPVQYTELEHFFEQEKDWTEVRETIRSIDRDAELTQAKLDYMRSQMVALQAEGNIPDGDATEALLALAKQEEVLETRRKDAMLLIASNMLTLQAHEKAEAQIRDEKMREPLTENTF